MGEIKVLVQYGEKPVNKIAFKCPKCGNWFGAYDVCDVPMNTSKDVEQLMSEENGPQPADCPYPPEINFKCPKCGYSTVREPFYGYSVEETETFPHILKKKIVWE